MIRIQRMSTKITLLFIGCSLALSWWLQSLAPQQEKGGIKVSLASDMLFTWQGFPVTNTLLLSIIFSLILMIAAVLLRRSLREIPGTFQNIAEALIEGFFNFVYSIMQNKEKTKRLFPLVFTLFLFILFANLFTFLPGLSAFTFHDVSLFRAAIADYNLVLGMTLTVVILIQIVAIVTNGPFGYLKKFINFSSPLAFVLGIMDIIGELSKILSMSFRLFGNIFAGEVLGVVILSLMPYFLPLPFVFLGLLSAIIQAFVFSLLTIIFVSMASEKAFQET